MFWPTLWSRVRFAWARLLRRAIVHDARKLALKLVVEEYRQEMPVTRCPCGHLMRWTPYYLAPGLSTLRSCPVCKRRHFAKMEAHAFGPR